MNQDQPKEETYKIGSIKIWVFFFLPHHTACGIPVPRPRINLVPSAVDVQRLNRWTTKQVGYFLSLVPMARSGLAPAGTGRW